MKPTVYIETTIISYLAARPSNNLIRAAQQRRTSDWWQRDRPNYSIVTSELTILEASAGDPVAAAERIRLLQDVPSLAISNEAIGLAEVLIHAGAFPAVAARDALHVAICATSGVSYLLTWNFKHLANAVMRDKIREECEAAGYAAPVICRPEEL